MRLWPYKEENWKSSHYSHWNQVDLLSITLGPGTASMSMIKAELEATNMVAMEKIKVIRPKSNLFGKALRKSSLA